ARNSSRNKGGAVTQLMQAVTQQKQFTEADKQIFLWQEEERRKRLDAIFRGKSVLWKAGDPIRDAMKAIRNLKSGSPPPHKPDIRGASPKGAAPFRADRGAILKVKEEHAENNAWARATSSGPVTGAQFALSAGAEGVAFQQMISALFNGGNSG